MEEIVNRAVEDKDIIDRLLELDISSVPEKTVMIGRFGLPIRIKGLSGKQFYNARSLSRRDTRKNGKTTDTRYDDEAFNVSLVVSGTVSPNWGDRKLLDKYGASGPEEVVKKVFLAGELITLADEIMSLSGFSDDGGSGIDEIKNG